MSFFQEAVLRLGFPSMGLNAKGGINSRVSLVYYSKKSPVLYGIVLRCALLYYRLGASSR